MPPICCSTVAEPSVEPALAYYWRTKSPESSRFFCTSPTFCLQISGEIKVGDALSNQRPLPCEGSTIVCLGFLDPCKMPANAPILYVDAFPGISGDLLGLLHGCCTS